MDIADHGHGLTGRTDATQATRRWCKGTHTYYAHLERNTSRIRSSTVDEPAARYASTCDFGSGSIAGPGGTKKPVADVLHRKVDSLKVVYVGLIQAVNAGIF